MRNSLALGGYLGGRHDPVQLVRHRGHLNLHDEGNTLNTQQTLNTRQRRGVPVATWR